MPNNTAAWLPKAKVNPLEIKEAPYTAPGPRELVVKNAAVAINPVDWKIQDFDFAVPRYPFIIGEDLSGTVAEVGSEISAFKVGDRVAAHPQALFSKKAENGGFQQYTVVPAMLASRIPDNLSFERACVIPLALNSAAAGLFQDDFLALPFPSHDPKPNGQTLLIWGGSSSVGVFTIQLAKAAGYNVITTASPKSHPLCKEVGADEVFDYNNSDIVQSIIRSMNGKKFVGAYDCISLPPTVKACGEILKAVGGGQTIACSLAAAEEYEDNVPGVTVKGYFANTVQTNKVGPYIWGEYLYKALESGQLRPKPDPRVVGHGLENIQTGINLLREGVSATKLVVRL